MTLIRIKRQLSKNGWMEIYCAYGQLVVSACIKLGVAVPQVIRGSLVRFPAPAVSMSTYPWAREMCSVTSLLLLKTTTIIVMVFMFSFQRLLHRCDGSWTQLHTDEKHSNITAATMKFCEELLEENHICQKMRRVWRWTTSSGGTEDKSCLWNVFCLWWNITNNAEAHWTGAGSHLCFAAVGQGGTNQIDEERQHGTTYYKQTALLRSCSIYSE